MPLCRDSPEITPEFGGVEKKTKFGWANEITKESRVSLPHPPLELKG